MGAPGTTPGPWVPTERRGYHEIIGPRPDSDWYGTKGVWAVAYCDTDREDDENIANANQIAASGTLYDALEGLLQGVRDICGPMEIDFEVEAKRPGSRVNKALAALAQARGEVSVHTLEGGL